jgi:hypothetical protein
VFPSVIEVFVGNIALGNDGVAFGRVNRAHFALHIWNLIQDIATLESLQLQFIEIKFTSWAYCNLIERLLTVENGNHPARLQEHIDCSCTL